MTPSALDLPPKSTTITWEKLPDDFILPDEPVDNNLQPLLAAALRVIPRISRTNSRIDANFL
jgi:hypothetical protein